MSATTELAHVVNFFMALLSMQHGTTTEISASESGDLRIRRISFCLRLGALVFSGLHVFMVGWAWLVGSLYIARTINVETMLINGVGVALLMDFDKTVFTVLVSNSVQTRAQRLLFPGAKITWEKRGLVILVVTGMVSTLS